MMKSRLAPLVGVCSVLVFGSTALAQEAPRVTDEAGFIGQTWSGGSDMVLPGFEDRGGGMVGSSIGVHYFQSRRDPRQWVLVSMLEVGRTGSHALWRGIDAVRHTTRDRESNVGFACKPERWGLDDIIGDSDIVGLIGQQYAADTGEYGLLRAHGAWVVTSEGRFVAVGEPVVCIDEGYGV